MKKYKIPIIISLFAILFIINFASASNPQKISSWTDLNNIRNNLSGDYILIKNLSSADADYIGIGNNWIPLGDENIFFTGTFEGQGYIISNFKVLEGYSYSGLFGYNLGNISNIGLINFSVSGEGQGTGSLTGANNGIIMNSYATGNVIGTGQFVGGLVGATWGGSIMNSYATGNVIGSNNDGTGGLIGLNKDSSIMNSYATGNVSGGNAGGLIGHNEAQNIMNSYATGNVIGSSAGGFIGSNFGWHGVAINCGWYDNPEDDATYAIGSSATSNPGDYLGTPENITYKVLNKEMFYNKSFNIYSTWNFSGVWIEQENDYPKLNFTLVPIIQNSTDDDKDGVPNNLDKCPNTKLPEKFAKLLPFRFGDIDADKIFETVKLVNGKQKIVDSKYTLTSTFGCSCSQILFLDKNKDPDEVKFGCKEMTLQKFIKKE
jgi:hypothetical protein